MRAVIYARVSTVEQVEGTSLATQRERCRAYAASQGWDLVGEYVDEGVSGAKSSRPALDRLLVAVRGDAVDRIVVAKLDRIGRSMRHLAGLLGELDDRSVVLVSVAEAFDSSTPSGRLQRNMLASFAEFEREQIRERMSAGQEASARLGRWVGGPPPFGYRIERSGRDAILAIHPDEAVVMRTAIDLVVRDRLTTGQAARELNQRGLLPRRAARWTGGNLRTMLQAASAISGTWEWRRPGRKSSGPPITILVPALISVETHRRLHDRLAETTTGHTNHSDRYLLAGRITSPHGAPMYGFTSSAPVYRCAQTFPDGASRAGGRCDCRTVRVEVADTIVWGEVCKVLADPARLVAMSGIELERAESTNTLAGEDLDALNRRVTRLEKAAGDQLSKLLASGLDPTIAQHTASRLTEQLQAARDHRDRVVAWRAASAERLDRVHRLDALARRCTDTLPAADTTTRRRILDILEVRVHVEGWERCATCSGAGRVSPDRDPEQNDSGRHRFGVTCPGCHRHRYLPRLTLSGVVPEAPDLETLETDYDGPRWPFRVASGGR